RARLRGLLLVAAAEALDAAGGVDDALLAREERVAHGADLDADLRLRGARRPRSTAGAVHGGLDVLGMDFGFHLMSWFAAGSEARPRRRREGWRLACGGPWRRG